MDIADVSPPPVFWRQKNLYSRVSRSAKEKPLMLHAVLYQPSYKAGTEPAVYGF
jgi:hypothetical protein